MKDEKRTISTAKGLKRKANLLTGKFEEEETLFLILTMNITSKKDKPYHIVKEYEVIDEEATGIVIAKCIDKNKKTIQNFIETPNKEEYQRGKTLEEKWCIVLYSEEILDGRH